MTKVSNAVDEKSKEMFWKTVKIIEEKNLKPNLDFVLDVVMADAQPGLIRPDKFFVWFSEN